MKKCLYYVYVWPEPLSSAAGLRCEQMITCLKQNGYEVELASPCTKNTIYESLIKKEYICHSVDPNNSETFQNLTKKDYHLILFDRYILEEQFGWRSRELWPNAIQIIDTQDLHSLRKNREDLLSKTYEESIEYNPEKQILDLHSHKDFTREIASILRADAALLLSTYEYSLLNEISIFPKNHLFYLPLSTPVEEDFPKFEDRSGLIFFGNFRHLPNLDAFRWLENKIYPALRRNIPEIPITIFGAYPPQEVSQVQKKLGVKFLGPIQNHRTILKQSLICIAPLRYGAGVKGKALESWACGTPVLGTPYLFEGLATPTEFEVFSSIDKFILSLKKIIQDPALWQNIQHLCLNRIREFSPSEDKSRFSKIIETICNQPPIEKISKKVIQNVLMSNEHSATKYFSKWIELKNNRSTASLDS